MGGDLALGAFLFQDLKHLNKLAEHQDLLSFGQQRLKQFEQRFGLAGWGIVADQVRVAADLPQPGERRQHVDFAFGHAFFGHRLHDLLAAAAQFGQVQFALLLGQFAVPAFLDAIGQILRHLPFEPAQHERAEFGSQPPARDFLRPGRVFASARLVGFIEMGLAERRRRAMRWAPSASGPEGS